jgi:hypothetical protein
MGGKALASEIGASFNNLVDRKENVYGAQKRRTYSRMIARHIGKHIPGNPNTQAAC